jgi:hypothetical protein
MLVIIFLGNLSISSRISDFISMLVIRVNEKLSLMSASDVDLIM